MEKPNKKSSILLATLVTAAWVVLLAGNAAYAQTAAISPLRPFTDIAVGTSYYDAARFLKTEGVIQGYPDGSLGIGKDINRAEFVKIILEAQENIEIKYDPKFSFPDVPATAWYAKYVSTAKREGIVKGYPDGTFKPDQFINYPESIKVVVERFNLVKNTGADYFSYYADSFKDQWFYNYLDISGSNNVYSASYDFEPSANITRGESMDMLFRTMVLKETGSSPYQPPYLGFNDQNGLLITDLKANYRLPVTYNNVTGPLHLKLYRATAQNFIESRSSTANFYWKNNLAGDEIKAKMTLVKEFNTEIIEAKTAAADPYYYDYYKRGYIELPVTAKGIYYLEADNRYLSPLATFLDVTDYSMVIRQGSTDNLVWVVNDSLRTPLAGAKVTAYEVPQNENITPLADAATVSANLTPAPYTKITELATKEDGTVLFKSSSANFFVAEKDGDITLLGNYRFDTADWNLKAYSYTDRNVYKPGNTVNFKSIIRKDIDGQYSLFPQQQVTLTVYNYLIGGENKVYETKLTTSAYGNINGSFKLSSEAQTGDYYMKIKFADGSESAYEGSAFKVEAYKKDEYQLGITTDRESYTGGDTVNVNIEGRYFFGAPVTGQEVTYKVYRQNTWWWPPCYGDICPLYSYYGRYDYYYPGSQDLVTSGKGTLDSGGIFKFSFKASSDNDTDYYDSYSRDSNYTIMVETKDQSNIPVRASSSFLVHGAEFNLQLAAQTTDPGVNRDYSVKIGALDHNGKGFAGASLHYQVTEQTYEKIENGTYYDYWLEKELPYYHYEYQENLVKEGDAKTDSSGNYLLTFKPERSASYYINVVGTDSRGNKVNATHYLYISGDDDYSPYYTSNNSLIVTSDRDNYEEGETAQFNVRNDLADSYVLLTAAKSNIIKYEVKKLSGKTLDYGLPLSTSMSPNLVLYADGINERKDLIYGQKEIKVMAKSKKLNVAVTADKSTTLPEDTVSFTVSATDAAGKPAQADLSFALVDKAVLAVLNLEAEDIHWIFFQPRYFYLNYAATPKIRMEAYRTGAEGGGAAEGAPMAAPSLGAGAKEDAKMSSADAFSVTEKGSLATRSLLLDTAYWNGSVQTDAETGKATIRVKVPHNLTTWVGTAVGNTKDTKVGSGTKEIITTKNLIISPFIPRFATEGDNMTLRVQARNINIDGSNFKVTLEGSGFTAKNTSVGATIPEGAGNTIEFPITVTGKDQMVLKFTMDYIDGLQKDVLSLVLPIKPFGQEKVTAYSGEDGATINLTAASGDARNIRSLKLTLAPTLADNLVKSLEYLVGYPYGCVEQTMSRFLPTVVAYSNRDKLKFQTAELFKEVDAQVNDGLQRLYAFQHGDGGWGWWENDDSTAKNTAYVMYGLTLAKKAGYAVNEEVYKKGHLALLEYYSLDYEGGKYVPYIGFVLSLIDPASFTQVKDYAPADKTLKTADLAYLALTHENLGHRARAIEFLAALKARATVVGNMAYFKETVTDYESMSSDNLATALALEAFSRIDVQNDIVPKLIRWFNINNSGYYHETHSTAHAIIALVNYLVSVGATGADYTYTVTLNGTLLDSGRLAAAKEISIPVSSLKAAGNTLIISKEGAGKLYYSMVQREILAKDVIAAEDHGVKIDRTYHNASGAEITGPLKAGDTVRVNLKVTVPAEYFYFMLQDKLPAGLEPVNPDLAKDTCYGDAGIITPYKYDYEMPVPIDNYNCGYYQGEYTDHIDLLDDRTVIFRTNLEAGEHNFSYFARAVTPGTFRVNPAAAEMMYAPEVNGNSASGTLVIE